MLKMGQQLPDGGDAARSPTLRLIIVEAAGDVTPDPLRGVVPRCAGVVDRKTAGGRARTLPPAVWPVGPMV